MSIAQQVKFDNLVIYVENLANRLSELEARLISELTRRQAESARGRK